MVKSLLLSVLISVSIWTKADEPDSVYLFSYVNNWNQGRNGLSLAWSTDQKEWRSIGNDYSFVKSDYGRWGSQKRMVTPFLLVGPDGVWRCVWGINENDSAFAYTESSDLINWKPQDYPVVKGKNCLRPIISYDKGKQQYRIDYISGEKYYRVTTSDFRKFSEAVEISVSDYRNDSRMVAVQSGEYSGQVHRVPWKMVEQLIQYYEWRQYRNLQEGELMAQDEQRFAGLKPVEATVTVQPDQMKSISDMLIGVFFEDISYAADGGLYAELIQNRDFEYAMEDKTGRDKNWNSTYAWSIKNEGIVFSIDTVNPIHPNNPHYAVLDVQTPGAALVNVGFDGIVIKKGDRYDLSLFSRQLDGKGGKLIVRLVDKQGNQLAEQMLSVPANGWKKQKTVLVATGTADDARLEIIPQGEGRVALDMISLFPQRTFKGRKNGLRADLAQAIADLHPRFVRFPGGCVAHGDGVDNIYRWVNTIGPLEARKPQRNLWNYHQTAGLGYYEYFQFCEDIGAEPLPVLAAGVPCQNSGTGGAGQQGGIPMCEMDGYIQEVLDLIEYANGDPRKTKWGKVRAESGHPAPFHLKYIGIGNEDLISEVFEERYRMICDAIREKYPEIMVIGTVGPFCEGSDYREGWRIATDMKLPMVDEHYYQTPGWFIHHQDFYDRYDRSKPKVYLGEYAVHVPGRHNNIETALVEALHLANVERNGDVVSMTSYAPLLAKDKHTNWNPDLIYFNNKEVKSTVGYYVQQLYGQNSGTQYLPTRVDMNNDQEAVRRRMAVSVVRDKQSGDVIVKLVNLLPVEINTQIIVPDIGSIQPVAIKTVLSGKPADKNARPVIGQIEVGGKFPCELPAYSFTVIRISTVAKRK